LQIQQYLKNGIPEPLYRVGELIVISIRPVIRFSYITVGYGESPKSGLVTVLLQSANPESALMNILKRYPERFNKGLVEVVYP